MRSLLDEASRAALRARCDALQPDAAARWGRFTAPQMLAHVIQSVRCMTGEVAMPAEAVPWVVRNAPLRQLLIYVLPFPKGLPTSPVLLERAAADPAAVTAAAWAQERAAFGQQLDAVGARADVRDWPPHAAFGAMTGRDWGVLQYRHIDHHFRQFGV